MKTITFVNRNFYLAWMTAFLLSGVLSYSQQISNQKTQFGFHNGFYFPEQKINLNRTPDDTNACSAYRPGQGMAPNRGYSPLLSRGNFLIDSSAVKYRESLCRIPEFTRSELNAMREQQQLMWDQYYRMWRRQIKIETYSIDVEGIVRGSKK